jgi:bifunctional UDP-N-acetylglucosamine pyrophosphorylase/glucosamine-1-phosphate N-acetyltransferase
MGQDPVGAIVLAAGLGTRMRSTRAKVLHELGGKPLLHYPLTALRTVGGDPVVVVVGHQAAAVRQAAEASGGPGVRTVLQEEQRGTGHAVRCALPALDGVSGDVLILYGDAPLIRGEMLQRLVEAHRTEQADLSLLTVRYADPTGYGRIVREADGRVRGIVEERDATPAERAITEVNPGFYCVRAPVLRELVAALRDDNAQREFYLTDIVGLAAGGGRRVIALETDRPDEVAGINTRAELARAETALRIRTVERLMAAGVTFEDPATAYVGPDVEIGPDTVVGPNVTLRGRTRIGRGCRLDGTSWLLDATLADGVHLLFGCWVQEAQVGAEAIIGPYARLRPGTELAERVHIGNFVETKKAVLGAGTKANHLTYLGDCEIGPDTNVGAGTITCNYDGFAKHRTKIGARVQIGSDTQLVAPVEVADDAYVAAGTTVTRDVPAGALAVSRTPLKTIEGWVERFRARQRKGR